MKADCVIALFRNLVFKLKTRFLLYKSLLYQQSGIGQRPEGFFQYLC
jgi:hypothetical protein